MLSFFKIFARIFLPTKLRHWCARMYPRISVMNTYVLHQPRFIQALHHINNKFFVKELSIEDKEAMSIVYRHNKSFESHIFPRLKTGVWTGLAVINSLNNEIAYISWIITANTQFINEFGIYLKKNQFFLRHGFCVPKYRHKGLHTRMEQERINYCVKHETSDIYIQIANHNQKGIKSVLDNGYTLYQQNYLIYISRLGIYRHLISFMKNPFQKVI